MRIAVLPGDGIGPEVTAEALKVLRVMEKKYDLKIEIKQGEIGGAAMEKYGTPLPEETIDICQEAEAVFLGSVGHPKWDSLPPEKRPEIGGLLKLRKLLQLYANIRPVVLFEKLKEVSPLCDSILAKKIDILIVRELASGIYFGQPRAFTGHEALDTMRYKVEEVERIARLAFEIAGKRRKKVTSVDKANVLHSSMLWRKVVGQVAPGFPQVRLNHLYVDNAAMQLILNPSQFDVILTSNLFGDILSDESAALVGSLGLLPSASIGEKINLYEPVGGSAPDIAGKGIANPIAQILCLGLMFEYSFSRADLALVIFKAVEQALNDGFRTQDVVAPGMSCKTTAEVGNKVCEYVLNWTN
ncbi:MAG: 3-isopropylmalate dehydrogenase [Candidatus Aminicenantes bacterium 4484_214]|nr:MAG: 3-isopropylmalate dehydrogenase [Candidatus Aminicenantes bacterium 4484_214]